MISVPTASCIETVSGRYVDLVNPDPSTIHVTDIAWGLSRMPRYVGHTLGEVPYSVAQHCVEAVKTVQSLATDDAKFEHLQIWAAKYFDETEIRKINGPFWWSQDKQILQHVLMHDASEAFITDVPTPLKQSEEIREVYGTLETKMMHAVHDSLGMLPYKKGSLTDIVVRWVDLWQLTVEAHHLMPSRGRGWRKTYTLEPHLLNNFTKPKMPLEAFTDFMKMSKELF